MDTSRQITRALITVYLLSYEFNAAFCTGFEFSLRPRAKADTKEGLVGNGGGDQIAGAGMSSHSLLVWRGRGGTDEGVPTD